MLNINKHTRS